MLQRTGSSVASCPWIFGWYKFCRCPSSLNVDSYNCFFVLRNQIEQGIENSTGQKRTYRRHLKRCQTAETGLKPIVVLHVNFARFALDPGHFGSYVVNGPVGAFGMRWLPCLEQNTQLANELWIIKRAFPFWNARPMYEQIGAREA